MRVFIATFPQTEVVHAIKTFRGELRKIKKHIDFLPTPDIHLTLRFLGPDVSQETIEDLTPKLQNIAGHTKPFEVRIGDIQFGFANDTKPRTLIALLEDNEYLSQLRSNIESQIDRRIHTDTYPSKTRVPHLTLGRIHGNIHSKKIREIREKIATVEFGAKDMLLEVNSFDLVNNLQVKRGEHFKKIKNFELRGK